MGFREEIVKMFRFSHVIGMRSFISFSIIFLYISIIFTLIINPKALNPSTNSLINFFLGGLQSAFTTILMFYFPIKREDKENSNKIENKENGL